MYYLIHLNSVESIFAWYILVLIDSLTFAAVEIPFKDLVNLCSECDVVIWAPNTRSNFKATVFQVTIPG